MADSGALSDFLSLYLTSNFSTHYHPHFPVAPSTTMSGLDLVACEMLATSTHQMREMRFSQASITGKGVYLDILVVMNFSLKIWLQRIVWSYSTVMWYSVLRKYRLSWDRTTSVPLFCVFSHSLFHLLLSFLFIYYMNFNIFVWNFFSFLT